MCWLQGSTCLASGGHAWTASRAVGREGRNQPTSCPLLTQLVGLPLSLRRQLGQALSGWTEQPRREGSDSDSESLAWTSAHKLFFPSYQHVSRSCRLHSMVDTHYTQPVAVDSVAAVAQKTRSAHSKLECVAPSSFTQCRAAALFTTLRGSCPRGAPCVPPCSMGQDGCALHARAPSPFHGLLRNTQPTPLSTRRAFLHDKSITWATSFEPEKGEVWRARLHR